MSVCHQKKNKFCVTKISVSYVNILLKQVVTLLNNLVTRMLLMSHDFHFTPQQPYGIKIFNRSKSGDSATIPEPKSRTTVGTRASELATEPSFLTDGGKFWVMKSFSYTRPNGTRWWRIFKRSNGKWFHKDYQSTSFENPRAARRKRNKSKRKEARRT